MIFFVLIQTRKNLFDLVVDLVNVLYPWIVIFVGIAASRVLAC